MLKLEDTAAVSELIATQIGLCEGTTDITAAATLRAIWREAGLPESEFARSEAPALLNETLEQHEEAVRRGVTGVPATAVAGSDAFVVGAHSAELYRRWIRRLQSGVLSQSD